MNFTEKSKMMLNSKDEILKEGFVVTLGQNMFSLPKYVWFSLRSTGLYYSNRKVSREDGGPSSKSVIEFESMFVRVEKLSDDTSRLAGASYRSDKTDVYCLRVGDKRKYRLLCFDSWEDRDYWVIAILTAIAQFKISGKPCSRNDLCAKIRYGSSTSTLRPNRPVKSGSTSSSRLAGNGFSRSFRKTFGSSRSRKSARDSQLGLGENLYASSSSSDVFSDEANTEFYKVLSPEPKNENTGQAKRFLKSSWDVIRRRNSQMNRTGSLKI